MDIRVTRRRFRPATALWFLTLAISTSPAPAQVVNVLKDLSGERVLDRAIDDAGTAVYAISSSNQYGTNPGFRKQIFRWDPVTGLGAQLTSFAEGVDCPSIIDEYYYSPDCGSLSVSDDDQWLAFISSADPAGANPDRSPEVFVMHPDGTGVFQVTSDTSYAGDGVLTAAIAGGGSRIVYVADTDPLGTNPMRTPHVFVVNRDGTGTVQLGELKDFLLRAAISDDGERVVYPVNDFTYGSLCLLFASPADGSTPPTVIASRDSFYCISHLAFSGNGETIAYESSILAMVKYDGTGAIDLLASGMHPSITDDGQTVFYAPVEGGAIWRINSDGTGATQVAAQPPGAQDPLVSGSGNRIAALATGELFAFDATGDHPQQLTVTTVRSGSIVLPRILANGSRVYFESYDDLLGQDGRGVYEIYTMLPGGTGLAQLTHQYVLNYSVSDAGLVVFESFDDPLGQNACGSWQLFKINANGTGLTQLTSGCTGTSYAYRSDSPVFRNDSFLIVFLSTQPIGTNADGYQEIMKMSGTGTAVAPITDENYSTWKYFSVSATPSPTWIAYTSEGNKDGLNPNHRYQIARINANAGNYLRITSDPVYPSGNPDISGDGNRIVWLSNADFVGQNPDHSTEVFLYDVPTATKRQLTNTTGGILSDDRYAPQITRDGAWVYYTLNGDLVRQSIASGAIERVVGFRAGRSAVRGFDADSTGARTVFSGQNVIGRGPSSSPFSLFLTDMNKKPAFTVGKAAPTLLDWDPDPQSTRYDVVRGDVANLAIVGSTVDLGPVTCIEDDSPDNNNLGDEDALQPDPGECFFYLYRGTVGVPPVTASWGQGTGARERVAGVAGCNP